MSDQSSALDGALSSPTISWAIVKNSKFENQAEAEIERTPQTGLVGSETEQTPTAPGANAPSSASPSAGSVTHGKFGYTLDELERLLAQTQINYVVEDLLPADDIHVAVGDSGLGKTPWAYQLGLCVAEGKPFLGHNVRKSSVLYYDLENGYEEILDVSRALCGHLGIKGSPKDFIVIPNDGNPPPIEDAVKERKPGLVIIDTLRALYPEAEMDNSRMGHLLKELRGIARKHHTAILLLHHLKKPPMSGRAGLSDTPALDWLLQASGPRALINQTNTRIGLDDADKLGQGDIALVMKSFVKVKGESGDVLLKRVFDTRGEPLGYERAAGIALLGDEKQAEAFNNLPDKFAFKKAKEIYGKTDNPTRRWLKKCEARGLIKQTGRGKYEKLEQPASAPSGVEGTEGRK